MLCKFSKAKEVLGTCYADKEPLLGSAQVKYSLTFGLV